MNQALIVLGEYALKLRLAEDSIEVKEQEIAELKSQLEALGFQETNVVDLARPERRE